MVTQLVTCLYVRSLSMHAVRLLSWEFDLYDLLKLYVKLLLFCTTGKQQKRVPLL
jgi:hypothetical protein